MRRILPALSALQTTALSIAMAILKFRGNMSDAATTHQSVICPGQQAMFDGEGAHYLRVVFMAYWADAMPSAEVFYVTGYPIRLNPRSIAMIEGDIMDLLHAHSGMRAMRVTYLSYSGVEMTPDDVAAADWRVVVGVDIAGTHE